MTHFQPQIDILSPPQRKLWPLLVTIPAQFVLYGGTAIALRLGHRRSVDFDFFSTQPLNEDELFFSFPILEQGEIIQREPNALTAILDCRGTVKISFFGNITTGRISSPQNIINDPIKIAGPLDLLAHKLKVILQRIEAKDYLDIAALLQSGISLADGLSGAQTLFGNRFPPMECLKALIYFEGGDLNSLPENCTQILTKVVKNFHPIMLEPVPLLSSSLD